MSFTLTAKKSLFLALFLLTACTGNGTVSDSSTEILPGLQGGYAVAYDPSEWLIATSDGYNFFYYTEDIRPTVDMDVKLQFEETQMDYNALKEQELDRLEVSSPNVELLLDEKRMVNGVEVLAVKLKTRVSNYDDRFTYAYYYTGPIGTIRFTAITNSEVMKAHEADIVELLNGLIIEE